MTNGPRQLGEVLAPIIDRLKHRTMPVVKRSAITLQPDGETFRLGGSEQATIVFTHDRFGVLCDLVAWLDGKPDRWFLRAGDETPILGARQLAGAAMMPGAIPVFPRPVDWVHAGGHGICILRWDAPLIGILSGVNIGLDHLPSAIAEKLRKKLGENFVRSLPPIVGGEERT